MIKGVKLFLLPLLILPFFHCSTDSGTPEMIISHLETHMMSDSSLNGKIFCKINIPDQGCIYANPAGPGPGLATVLKPEGKGIIFGSPEYPAGEKYTPAGEDHVFIYRHSAIITVPFTVNESAPEDSCPFSVKAEILFCGKNSCTPMVLSVSGTIRLREAVPHVKAENNVTVSEPEKTSRLNSSSSDIEFKPVYSGMEISGLLQAVILGLLAGFLLNFMPCVLPVISIKVMNFAAGKKAGSGLKHGMAFSAGILLDFLILAGLAAWAGFRWGQLFQYRAFVLVMAAVVFILGLSLTGLFSLNIPGFAGKASAANSGKNGYFSSFFNGILATALATPCSGPLLGGILAWTVNSSPTEVFAVFISAGTGMALPYLLFSAFPPLLKRMPEPGPWMNVIEKFFGFLLFLTSVYLLSVLGKQDIISACIMFVFTAAGLMIWDRSRFSEGRKRKIRWFMSALLLAAGIMPVLFSDSGQADVSLSAEKFSMSGLLENSRAGRITVVYFTADWCPSCRLAEAAGLHAEDTEKELIRTGAVLMTADITAPFPEAQHLMKNLGTESIPFLAVFPSGDSFTKPVCIRDIYTSADVIKAVRQAEKLSD